MKFVKFKTREEWHQWRFTGIGSSDAMAVMGCSPWMTRDQLWAMKMELLSPPKTMPWMKRGLDLEPLARREYIRQSGVEVTPENVQHDTHKFLIASLDGLNVKRKKVVEIKCPGKTDHETALRGKVPDKYRWQLLHQLLVTGYDELDYFSFDGETGVIVKFQMEPIFGTALLNAEIAFWETIKTGTAPKPERDLNFQEKLAKVIALKGRK